MGLGDHPETFLLKALCCQSAPSSPKVVGWWVGGGWVMRFYCQHWDCFDSRFSIFDSQSQVPVPVPVTPSPLKVGGGWVGGPGHFTVSTGTVSILVSRFSIPSPKSQSQSQSLDNTQQYPGGWPLSPMSRLIRLLAALSPARIITRSLYTAVYLYCTLYT